MYHTGFVSYNFLRQGEQYNEHLKNTFQNVSITHLQVPKEVLLPISNKAMIETLSSEGLVLSTFVFGYVSRNCASDPGYLPQPDFNNRAKAVMEACSEIASQRAKFCLNRDLQH